jgi:hypothetical protein
LAVVEFLTDQFTWIILAIAAAVMIAFGIRRREPAWAIGANLVAMSAFLLGFGLASRLGDEAFLAAALASGGLGLAVEISHRMRRRHTHPSNARA